MWKARAAAAMLGSMVGACGASSSADAAQDSQVQAAALPDAWDQQLALTPLVDEDPAQDVVEVRLDARVSRVEIAEGHSVQAFTYSGLSPGPLIRAKEGDTLRVHFSNNLPEATTIHWHGLEVPADQDGAGHAGTEIAPGKTFDYEFKLPHAGTYWYHPHLNSAEQVWRGLYGALIVEAASEPPLGDELTLLLHDIALDDSTGELAPAASQGDLGRFFGHEGFTLLVNGRIRPEVQVYSGSTLRLRVINASISRYYKLAVSGHKLTRVAGDSGLIEQSQQLDDVLVVPGERSELVLTVQASAGEELRLRALPYDRFACGGACNEAQDLLSMNVVPGKGRTRAVPAELTRIEPIDQSSVTKRELSLSETTRAGQTALAINDRVYGDDTLMLDARVETNELWTVKNDTDYDHPFHLHGFRFQVVEQNGQAPLVRAWSDTVNVAARKQVRFVVHFDDRPGMWMFHCHILDHADLGMMGTLHLH